MPQVSEGVNCIHLYDSRTVGIAAVIITETSRNRIKDYLHL